MDKAYISWNLGTRHLFSYLWFEWPTWNSNLERSLMGECIKTFFTYFSHCLCLASGLHAIKSAKIYTKKLQRKTNCILWIIKNWSKSCIKEGSLRSNAGFFLTQGQIKCGRKSVHLSWKLESTRVTAMEIHFLTCCGFS